MLQTERAKFCMPRMYIYNICTPPLGGQQSLSWSSCHWVMVHAAWKTAYEVHSCEMLRGGDCKVSKLVMNRVLYSEEQQFTSMATVGWDTSAQQHLFFSIVHKDQMGHEQKLGSDAMLLTSRGPARSFRLALKEPHPTPNACNYTGPQEMYQAHTGNSFRVMRIHCIIGNLPLRFSCLILGLHRMSGLIIKGKKLLPSRNSLEVKNYSQLSFWQRAQEIDRGDIIPVLPCALRCRFSHPYYEENPGCP